MQLTSTDWVLVLASLAGPVLAVQAQKMVERLTESRRRKQHIFRVLMATRATRLSTEHVQALNMIEIEFSGSSVLKLFRYQSASEKKVINAWRDYLDSLGPLADNATEDDKKRWNEKTIGKFVDLLFAISTALSFDFDRVQINKGVYWPIEHSKIEAAQVQIRDSLVKILSGQQSFPMTVTGFPVSEDALRLQMEVQTAMLAVLKGDKPVKVSTDGASS